MMRRCFVVVCVAVLLALSAGAEAVEYSIQDLGTLAGGHSSEALGISGRGLVVGTSDDSSYRWHAVLWNDGGVQAITLPGDTSGGSQAVGINDSGQVVVQSWDSSGRPHAFLWDNGVVQAITPLAGGTYSNANGINDSGQVVGYSYGPGGNHAVIWQGSSVQDFGPGTGNAISDNGQVAGYFYNAVRWQQNGIMRTLGSGNAYGINDSGQTVGYFSDSNSVMHACLWQNGTTHDLGPGIANGINNSGQIVGDAGNYAVMWQNNVIEYLGLLAGDTYGQALAINGGGQIAGQSGRHAVLWTPTLPEPSSVLALLCGLGGLGSMAWRRRG